MTADDLDPGSLRSWLDSVAAGGDPAGPSAAEPSHIGHYRILARIGAGGMGTVYRAEQTDPVRREVAVKLISPGLDSRAMVRRFEQERQTLALMQHDGIARVLDCGSTGSGRPFLVMELVPGEPITAYCDRRRLTLRERVRLLQQACAAVQHAHQKGVVHRDLKPSNLLVDGEGSGSRLKVIDFGLAKITGGDAVAADDLTQVGQAVGTPEYMAPEQADPGNGDIDTRADVYALGVVAYELLSGCLPFLRQELRQGGWLQMVQRLREVDPPRPSARVAADIAAADVIARDRSIAAGALVRSLRDDLDWVVAKAMAKDREWRYESAAAFAADLQRFLDGRPVDAGPPSTTYRLRKFVRRNAGRLGAVALVFVATLAGGVATWRQYRRAEDRANEVTRLLAAEASARRDAAAEAGRARAAEAEANRRAEELRRVAEFQASQLENFDLQGMGVQLRDAVTASLVGQERAAAAGALADLDFTTFARRLVERHVFDRSLAAIAREFAAQPLVEARLLQAAASTMRGLGMAPAAAAPQAEALAIRRRELGDDHEDTLRSFQESAVLEHALAHPAECVRLLRETLPRLRRVFGEDDALTLAAMSNLAAGLQEQNQLAEAEALAREVIERKTRKDGETHPETLRTMNNLGVLLTSQGRLAEAVEWFDRALRGRRAAFGPDHPDVASGAVNLGSVLLALGRGADAERLLREGYDVFRRLYGDEHPSTLTALGHIAGLLYRAGRNDEAEPLYRQVLEVSRRRLPVDHYDLLLAINNLGAVELASGRPQAAVPLLREALEGRRRTLGSEHPDTMSTASNLGCALLAAGQTAAAELLLREAVVTLERVAKGSHPFVLKAVRNLGRLLAQGGRDRELVELYAPRLETARSVYAGQPGELAAFLRAFALAQDHLGGAERWAQAADLLRETESLLGAAGEPVAERLAVLREALTTCDHWRASAPGEAADGLRALIAGALAALESERR
ncbi:MAG: serine/threonine-protein kinase [Planctomycetota bacterium]